MSIYKEILKDLPSTTTEREVTSWTSLLDILRYLRSEHGCQWDQKQTVASLRPHIIEEPTELLEAIGNLIDNPSEVAYEHLKEELGDVLLVLIMMIIVYEQDEKDSQALSDIIGQLNEKLIRRHPHVFEDAVIENHDQLHKQWNQIKTEQEGKKTTSLDKYKDYMHILERTKELQKRMQKEHNFFGESIAEKTTQLAYAIQSMADFEEIIPPKGDYSPTPDIVEKAIGDALFSLIDIARIFKVSPTSALTRKVAFELNKCSD